MLIRVRCLRGAVGGWFEVSKQVVFDLECLVNEKL